MSNSSARNGSRSVPVWPAGARCAPLPSRGRRLRIAAVRRLPLVALDREEVDARFLVLLRRIERLLLVDAGVDGQVVDDRLALIDRAAVHDRVEVVRPVVVDGAEVAVRD